MFWGTSCFKAGGLKHPVGLELSRAGGMQGYYDYDYYDYYYFYYYYFYLHYPAIKQV